MPRRTRLAKSALERDAKNRAARSAYQGALVLGVVAFLTTVAAALTKMDDPAMVIIGSGLTAALVPVASYVMRRYGDASAVPTPTPPSDPGE